MHFYTWDKKFESWCSPYGLAYLVLFIITVTLIIRAANNRRHMIDPHGDPLFNISSILLLTGLLMTCIFNGIVKRKIRKRFAPTYLS